MKKIFIFSCIIGLISCGPSEPVKDILSIETVSMIGNNSAYITLPSVIADGYNDMSSARPLVTNATITAFEGKYKVKITDFTVDKTPNGGVARGLWVKF